MYIAQRILVILDKTNTFNKYYIYIFRDDILQFVTVTYIINI